MSSNPSALLFYGIVFNEDGDLARSLGLNPDDDSIYDIIEDIFEKAGLEYQIVGNYVLGYTNECISIAYIEVYGCGIETIDIEKFKIPQEKLDALQKFLKNYNISIEPGWHLGVCYG